MDSRYRSFCRSRRVIQTPYSGTMAITRRDVTSATRTGIWVGLPFLLVAYFSSFPLDKVGWDAHAYWNAWHIGLYTLAPGELDAYLYSPAFAEAIWPLTLLPFWAFFALWSALTTASLWWLLKPVRLGWRLPLLAVAWALAILPGNVYAFMPVAAALGLRFPAVWAFPILTKVTPGVGVLWFAARKEWRQLAVALGTTSGVIVVSAVIAPHLWADWLHFLLTTHSTVPVHFAPPVWIRTPFAAAVVIWGARTERRWTIAVAMALASPMIAPPSLLVLTAIPRLERIRQEGQGVSRQVTHAPVDASSNASRDSHANEFH